MKGAIRAEFLIIVVITARSHVPVSGCEMYVQTKSHAAKDFMTPPCVQDARFLPWTVKPAGPGLHRHSFNRKRWRWDHLCPLAYIESLKTLNGLLETNLFANIGRGKYSCKKRQAKQREQSGADLVTYCNLIISCLNVFDDIWSPCQAPIVHSVRHKVDGAFNNYLC